LANLTTAQKGPYVIRLIGAREASSRGAASLLEVGQTITGWPQLGSEITLGAATVAAAVRRIGLGGELPSDGALRRRRDSRESRRLRSTSKPKPTLHATAARPPLESDDPIEMIVDAARRAPSGGNVQPWRFEASDDEIRFFMIPSARPPWTWPIRDVRGHRCASSMPESKRPRSRSSAGETLSPGRPSHTSPHCNSDPQMTWRSHLYANISRVDRPIAESASVPNRSGDGRNVDAWCRTRGAQLHFATERVASMPGGIARGVRSPAVLVADRAPRDAVGDPLAGRDVLDEA